MRPVSDVIRAKMIKKSGLMRNSAIEYGGSEKMKG